MMHLAAQYLAAAGISFVEKKSDDSHTSLKYEVNNTSLYTLPLNVVGDTLSLNYKLFALEWNSKNNTETILLNGRSHKEVLNWIRTRVKESGIEKKFNYTFHYDLPYAINDDFTFLLERDALKKQTSIRTLAQNTIESFLLKSKLQSDVRTWPHHFDSGAFSILNEDGKFSIGLGLAIPDAVCDDFYFYISAYKGHQSFSTEGFLPIKFGLWKNNGFKGAILPASQIMKEQVEYFFEKTFEIYMNEFLRKKRSI